MSAVMSSCGNRPGTSAFTWMPYGPHSTASVSVRLTTPALAAAEWAKPGPPVQAYEAAMLTIEPGVPAARWRRPNSRAHRKVPLRVMSTTVRQALGDMSSAGTGKLAAALLTSTWGIPKASAAASKAAATASASRMSHAVVMTGAPMASMASTAASRCSGLRLATTSEAPRRANSPAMALPRPVPPPVTNTHTPSKVPGTSAVAPTAGGAGNPICSATTIVRPAQIHRTGTGSRCPGTEIRCQMGQPAAIPGDQIRRIRSQNGRVGHGVVLSFPGRGGRGPRRVRRGTRRSRRCG